MGLGIATDRLENFTTEQWFKPVTLIPAMGHFTGVDTMMQQVKKMLQPGVYVLVENRHMDSSCANCIGSHWHTNSQPNVSGLNTRNHFFSAIVLTVSILFTLLFTLNGMYGRSIKHNLCRT